MNNLDLSDILTDLRARRDRLSTAIEHLEGLAADVATLPGAYRLPETKPAPPAVLAPAPIVVDWDVEPDRPATRSRSGPSPARPVTTRGTPRQRAPSRAKVMTAAGARAEVETTLLRLIHAGTSRPGELIKANPGNRPALVRSVLDSLIASGRIRAEGQTNARRYLPPAPASRGAAKEAP